MLGGRKACPSEPSWWISSSFTSLLRCHLLNKASSNHHILNGAHSPAPSLCSVFPSAFLSSVPCCNWLVYYVYCQSLPFESHQKGRDVYLLWLIWMKFLTLGLAHDRLFISNHGGEWMPARPVPSTDTLSLAQFILPTTSRSRYCYCSPLRGEETEAQRFSTCLKGGFKPRIVWLQGPCV